MASTYTNVLGLELQVPGENSNTWGTKNNTVISLIEDAISNMATVNTTGGTTTLTTTDGATNQSRMAVLKITGALTSAVTIEIPAYTKKYLVWNATTNAYSVTVKVTGQTGAVVTQGYRAELFCDGTTTYHATTELVAPILGTPGSGTLTNCTGLPISTGISGLGAGIATLLATPSSANLAAAVTDETGSGALVFGTSPTLTTPVISGAMTYGGVALTAAVTGTGKMVLDTSPTLVTPALGTPSALVGTNITGTAAGLTAGAATTATTATKATNLAGGTVGNVAYQSSADTTTFLINGGAGTVLVSGGVGSAPSWTTVAGTGTVVSVSVAAANGVSGSVATATSTPAITLTLGDITPNSVVATAGVSGTQLTSTTASGTAPLVVTSTTQVTNLNAEKFGNLTTAQVAVLGTASVQALNVSHFGSLTTAQVAVLGTASVQALNVSHVGSLTTADVVSLTGTQTLSNKTLTAPVLGVATATSISFGEATLSKYAIGSYTGSLTGCTTTPTSTIYYTQLGNAVTLNNHSGTELQATSNSTACTVTGAPAGIRPASNSQLGLMIGLNSSAGVWMNAVMTTAGTISFENQGGVFTAAGVKGPSYGINGTYSTE